MAGQPSDAAAIDAEVNHIRSLGIVALRARWRMMFHVQPPAGLPKDCIARMIAYRIQEAAFGGIDKDAAKLLDRCGRGEKPGGQNRQLKPGTVLVREYNGIRHTVTVASGGFLWQETTYASLSTIARAITGTSWNGPRFFGLRVAAGRDAAQVPEPKQPAPRAVGSGLRVSTSLGHPSRKNRGVRGRAHG